MEKDSKKGTDSKHSEKSKHHKHHDKSYHRKHEKSRSLETSTSSDSREHHSHHHKHHRHHRSKSHRDFRRSHSNTSQESSYKTSLKSLPPKKHNKSDSDDSSHLHRKTHKGYKKDSDSDSESSYSYGDILDSKQTASNPGNFLGSEKIKKQELVKGKYPLIDSSDYFSMNSQFRKYLELRKHETLDELSSENQRKEFQNFVEKWNTGKLPQLIYEMSSEMDEIIEDDILSAPRMTKHKWNFTNVNKDELQKVIRTVKENSNSTDGNKELMSNPLPSKS